MTEQTAVRTLAEYEAELAEMDKQEFLTHLTEMGEDIETKITDVIDAVEEIKIKLAICMGDITKHHTPKEVIALSDLHTAWQKLASALHEAHGRYGDVDYA